MLAPQNRYQIIFQEQFYSMKPLGKNLAINTFPEYLDKIGIIPGIKVDTGAKEFSCHPDEK